MKDLTSSVYTFEKLIEGNYLYIDKTEYIWKLLKTAYGQYFMSRPRRFGKSLTISTLEAVFSGKKELFKGLALYDKPYDWQEYPIIHLDLGDRKNDTPQALEESLQDLLSKCAKQHQVELIGDNAQTQFSNLIDSLAQSGKVVILVDEYDKPILGNATNPEVGKILEVLKGFYSVIKNSEPYLRFVFMTGVSKFAHVSVFSDLNNLTDITMAAEYATMMGYTQEELEHNFADRIDVVSEKLQMDRNTLLPEVKAWYNGYRFHAQSATVYNPVSIAQFFTSGGEFNNYWFATGTPTFLLELVKKTNFNFEEALSRPVNQLAFDAYEVNRLDPLALLLQTGYLTIRSTEQKFGMTWYWLDFPNREVSFAFNTYLLNAYTRESNNVIGTYCARLAEALSCGNVDEFMKVLQVFFTDIPYDVHVREEKYFQSIFYVLFKLLGIYIEAEARTNDGRIDAVARSNGWAYLFEFKLDKDAEIALTQIKEKDYCRRYLLDAKRLVLVGANFDFSKGQLTDWVSEEVKK